MREYSWKSTSYKNVEAQLVGEELEKLEIAGEITPQMIVDYAEKNPDSELHKCFEWDDTEASRKFRMHQAFLLLGSISVKITEKPVQKQRIYVNVRTSSDGTKKYKNIKEVVKNDEEYQQLIDKAQRDFVSCKERYETILEKDDLKDVIFKLYREI
jgi:hypothetical protein